MPLRASSTSGESSPIAPTELKIPVARLEAANDHDLLRIRRHARLISEAAGLTLRDQTRLITAIGEIARNAVDYAHDGIVDFVLRRAGGENLLEVRVCDEGPGIDDVDHVLNERFAERNSAGLGVAGARRLVHRFTMETDAHGTHITLGMAMPSRNQEDIEAAARRAVEAIAGASMENPQEELVRQNRALVESLAEKDYLIREIHHRVKNNFQLISSLARLQARRAEGTEAKALLESLAMRIRGLGVAHDQLYRFDDLSRVRMNTFIGQLCDSLHAAFVEPDQDITLSCELTEDAILDQDEAMDVAVIVNELVGNSIRHAFPDGRAGEIRIESSATDDALTLVISDDGVGADSVSGLPDADSLGVRLVQGSVRRLGGEMQYLTPARGTAVRIVIPRLTDTRAFQSVI